ncbi:hypothetical protein OpiT1DRAFT_00786 [Opitutaceae bacterium TAV1]|nr:hypothetical protein OpiT1DRAFT_00786 [Opitutaceae bacterium TAV1]
MATDEWNSIDAQKRDFPIYYCAFLDILGYKNKSEAFFRNEFNLPDRIERAAKTITLANSITSILVDVSGLKIESFSDSIVILKPANSSIAGLLQFSAHFVSNLSFEGLFVRGGISVGKHFDETGELGFRVLASEALQRAYLLESKRAITPRVIVDPAVLDYMTEQEKDMLIKDGSDYMLHFSNYAINREGDNLDIVFKEMEDIKRLLDGATELGVREKYQWILDYYYWTIAQIGETDLARFLPFTSLGSSKFQKIK